MGSTPDPLDDYELSFQEFYSELPGRNVDYLNDINPDIQDEHESDDSGNGGLSAEQVSQIARDSLADVQPPTSDSPSLFPDDQNQN